MRRIALAALLLGMSAARGDTVSPQIGGGLRMGFDGGIYNGSGTVSSPVTPCSQTGLIFTSGCNAILYVVLF